MKNFEAHLKPMSHNQTYTFHKQDGEWVCEEKWPNEENIHDVLPHGRLALGYLYAVLNPLYENYKTKG